MAIQNQQKETASNQICRCHCARIFSIMQYTKEYVIRRNNNKVDFIKTRRIVIVHLLP